MDFGLEAANTASTALAAASGMGKVGEGVGRGGRERYHSVSESISESYQQ